jgi:hypothetical protein
MDHDYQRRLAETVAWCAGRARVDDAGRSTRTLSLLPQVLRDSLDSSLFQAVGATNAARDAVSFICEQRRAILASSKIPVADVGADLAGGRILCTDFDSDLCSAATAPSDGFVDDEDIPGWDTWFAYDAGVVHCWIPPGIVPLAQAAIDVIPVDCLWWLDDPPGSRRCR